MDIVLIFQQILRTETKFIYGNQNCEVIFQVRKCLLYHSINDFNYSIGIYTCIHKENPSRVNLDLYRKNISPNGNVNIVCYGAIKCKFENLVPGGYVDRIVYRKMFGSKIVFFACKIF